MATFVDEFGCSKYVVESFGSFLAAYQAGLV